MLEKSVAAVLKQRYVNSAGRFQESLQRGYIPGYVSAGLQEESIRNLGETGRMFPLALKV